MRQSVAAAAEPPSATPPFRVAAASRCGSAGRCSTLCVAEMGRHERHLPCHVQVWDERNTSPPPPIVKEHQLAGISADYRAQVRLTIPAAASACQHAACSYEEFFFSIEHEYCLYLCTGV